MALFMMASLGLSETNAHDLDPIWSNTNEDGVLEIRRDPLRSRWRGKGNAELYFYLKSKKDGSTSFYHNRVGEVFGLLTESIFLEGKDTTIVIDDTVQVSFDKEGDIVLSFFDTRFRLSADQALEMQSAIWGYFKGDREKKSTDKKATKEEKGSGKAPG